MRVTMWVDDDFAMASVRAGKDVVWRDCRIEDRFNGLHFFSHWCECPTRLAHLGPYLPSADDLIEFAKKYRPTSPHAAPSPDTNGTCGSATPGEEPTPSPGP